MYITKSHPKVPVKIFFLFRLLQTAQITPAPQIQNMMDFHSIETKGTDCFMSFNTVFLAKTKILFQIKISVIEEFLLRHLLPLGTISSPCI